eukprot:GHVH01011570.1.p1 GENE.GHVH01011570.1~~GHVH01011570.1.p1  ORF type:complete len:669 (+),score=77.41 GHVH01011570.1:76-2082(+)
MYCTPDEPWVWSPYGRKERRKKKIFAKNAKMTIFTVTWNLEYLDMKESDLSPNPETGVFTKPNQRVYEQTVDVSMDTDYLSSSPKVLPSFDNCTLHPEKPLMVDLLPKNYDIYVLCFQEVKKAMVMLKAACLHLNENLPQSEVNTGGYVLVESDRVVGISGHGDGALISKKMTSISIIIRKVHLSSGLVKMGSNIKVELENEGCKGAVGRVLFINNDPLLLMNCHMPSKNAMVRCNARMTIVDRVITMLKSQGFEIDDSTDTWSIDQHGSTRRPISHRRGVDNPKNTAQKRIVDIVRNVIFAGDFNMRSYPPPDFPRIELKDAVDNLYSGGFEILYQFDEVNSHRYVDPSKQKNLPFFPVEDYVNDWRTHYKEGPINFPPSYKKRPGRVRVHKEPLSSEYIFNFKNRWYKGISLKGKKDRNKESIPSWCDRIVYNSLSGSLKLIQNSYTSVRPAGRPSTLMASDHDAVVCGFTMDYNNQATVYRTGILEYGVPVSTLVDYPQLMKHRSMDRLPLPATSTRSLLPSSSTRSLLPSTTTRSLLSKRDRIRLPFGDSSLAESTKPQQSVDLMKWDTIAQSEHERQPETIILPAITPSRQYQKSNHRGSESKKKRRVSVAKENISNLERSFIEPVMNSESMEEAIRDHEEREKTNSKKVDLPDASKGRKKHS